MLDGKISILVVDDEVLNLEIVEHILKKAQYDVVCVSDGVKALEELKSSPTKYDLVLLDRMMPEMDGMETLRQIKNSPELEYLPVIMQTAASSKEQVEEGLESGASYYLTKPFSKEKLLEVISEVVDDISKN